MLYVDIRYLCETDETPAWNDTDAEAQGAVKSNYDELLELKAASDSFANYYVKITCLVGTVCTLLTLATCQRARYKHMPPVRLFMTVLCAADSVQLVVNLVCNLWFDHDKMTVYGSAVSVVCIYIALLSLNELAEGFNALCILVSVCQTFYAYLKPMQWRQRSETSRHRLLSLLLVGALVMSSMTTVHSPIVLNTRKMCYNCTDDRAVLVERHMALIKVISDLTMQCLISGLILYFSGHTHLLLVRSSKIVSLGFAPTKAAHARHADRVKIISERNCYPATERPVSGGRNQAAFFLLRTAWGFLVCSFPLLVINLITRFLNTRARGPCKSPEDHLYRIETARLQLVLLNAQNVLSPFLQCYKFFCHFAFLSAFRKEVFSMFRDLFSALKRIFLSSFSDLRP